MLPSLPPPPPSEFKIVFWVFVGTKRVLGRRAGRWVFGSPNRNRPEEIGTVGKYDANFAEWKKRANRQ